MKFELSTALALLLGVLACRPPPAPDAEDGARAEAAQGWRRLDGTKTGDAKRGEYIATIGACAECHTLRASDGSLDRSLLFAGGIPFAGPWGLVHSGNVSVVARKMPDAQLEDMIRGRLAYKFQMPTDLYATMAADDMTDLIAFLRTVNPVPREVTDNEFAEGYDPPPPLPREEILARAPQGPTRERGEYLSRIAICQDCHSPRDATGLGYDRDHLFAGGGLAFRARDGRLLIPPNLTPDP